MAAVVAFMYARKRAGIKAEAEEREKNEQDRMNQTAMGRGNTMKNLKEAAARATIASKLGRAWRKRGVKSAIPTKFHQQQTMLLSGCRISPFLDDDNYFFCVAARCRSVEQGTIHKEETLGPAPRPRRDHDGWPRANHNVRSCLALYTFATESLCSPGKKH